MLTFEDRRTTPRIWLRCQEDIEAIAKAYCFWPSARPPVALGSYVTRFTPAGNEIGYIAGLPVHVANERTWAELLLLDGIEPAIRANPLTGVFRTRDGGYYQGEDPHPHVPEQLTLALAA